MPYCVHGNYYWTTDRAGKRFRYCAVCHKVVMPKKKPKPLKYRGGGISSACHECGNVHNECIC